MLSSDKKFFRDLDYTFRLFRNLNFELTKLTLGKQQVYVPVSLINIVNIKIKSLQNKLNNIEIILA